MAAMLDFRKTELPDYCIRLLTFHDYTKCGEKIVLGAQIMAPKRNQNGSLRHLELISIGYF